MNIRHGISKYRFAIGRRLVNKHVILELRDATKLDRREFPEETILTVASIDEIPPQTLKQIREILGNEYVSQAEALFQSPSAHLTILLVGDALATVSWVRSGADIPSWLMPLTEQDQVFSRGYTVPEFRGKGCYARCIAAAHDHILNEGQRFLTDCHIYNKASIRQFQRSGFDVLAHGRW